MSINRRTMRVAWLLAAAALAVAGCAGSGKAPVSRDAVLVGLWVAEEIAGKPALATPAVTLSLYGDGKAVGRAGCNNYATSYTEGNGVIQFKPPIATKMACAPDVMAQETSYFEVLTAATRYKRRAEDGALVLATDGGAEIRFRREESGWLKDARARGIDFRAIGQEPGWVAEVQQDQHITAILDYGATTVLLPTPPAEAAPDGAVVYNATNDIDRLTLKIKGKVCIDPMSGESHSSTVELVLNEKSYHGCGDWLD